MSSPPEQPNGIPISTSESTTLAESEKVDEKPEPETTTSQTKSDDAPYSAFGLSARRRIVLAATCAGFFSPLSASIYYPALPQIAEDFNVSISEVNLTVTTYLIIQGLAPMITAGFSDTAGRRPAYAICFFIYFFANLGLALQNSYPALLVLRCLQSAGSSGTVAITNGVVSDLVTPQERGSFIAITSISTILGPSISPVIGGLLAQYLGWHWIFWFLVIFSGAFCVPFFLFFPETCRKVVGDGSVFPPPLNRSLTDYIRRRKQRKAGETAQAAPQKPKLSLPNPLLTLRVLLIKHTAMVLLPSGIAFGALYAVLTGASDVFKTVYGFNEVKVSLMYIPLGVGGVISGISTGKLVDWNFQRHAKRLGVTVTKNRNQDLSNFPVETARLEITLPVFYLMVAALIIYGWIVDKHEHVSGPIIILIVLAWTLSAVYQILNVLLVDTYPGKGATVTAAVNLVRCELGAVFASVIGPMSEGVGNGWAYTILALIGLATTPMLLLTSKYGIKWRAEATEKERIKAEKKNRALES